jgi:hypothetical protein
MRSEMVCLVMAAALVLVPMVGVGQEQTPAPSFKVGDVWQFKAREWDFTGYRSNPVHGTYEIIYGESGFKLLSLAGDKREGVDLQLHTAGILFALLGRSKTFQDLRFPLSVGDQWNHEYRGRHIAGQEHRRSVEIRVTGIEQVTTAAGTFRAFKLEKDDRAGPRDFWLTTYFYSPETKSVVKSMFDASSGTGTGGKREIELVKFGAP